MFCMAWFMELSRLSNSLGSVCSQRRGRLAAVAGRPRLPRSLSHHSPPIPSLQSHRGVFCVRFCLIVYMSTLLQLTCEGVVLVCPGRLWHWPDHWQDAKANHGAPTQWCSVGRTLARSLLLQTPTWGASASVEWSLVRVPTASPAVQSDILHSACTRQVLSGESGASVRSGDCGGLENLIGAKLLLENFDFSTS